MNATFRNELLRRHRRAVLMRAGLPYRVCIAVVYALFAAPLAAQRPPSPDSIAPPPPADSAVVRVSTGDRSAGEPFFTATDAWLGLGFAAGTVALAPLDQTLANALQDSTLQVHAVLGDFADGFRLLGFPGTVIIGGSMYAIGRVGGNDRLAAIGLHSTEAVALSFGIVGTIKGLAGRARPARNPDDPFDMRFARGLTEGSDYRSFPSGHTAAAFAFAAAVTSEMRRHSPEASPWVGAALYTGAALVGVSRMYHNRHWASDVIGGAAIGTFSGLKVVHYHYRNPDNPLDRWLLATRILPTTDGGLAIVWTVPMR